MFSKRILEKGNAQRKVGHYKLREVASTVTLFRIGGVPLRHGMVPWRPMEY